MLIIRLEKPEDETAIRHVNEEAFGQKAEAEIIDRLRNRNVVTLSLVAAQADQIVGHILFSPVTVESELSSFEIRAREWPTVGRYISPRGSLGLFSIVPCFMVSLLASAYLVTRFNPSIK